MNLTSQQIDEIAKACEGMTAGNWNRDRQIISKNRDGLLPGQWLVETKYSNDAQGIVALANNREKLIAAARREIELESAMAGFNHEVASRRLSEGDTWKRIACDMIDKAQSALTKQGAAK